MTKKIDDTQNDDTQQLPAVEPVEQPASFADKVEDLMNHAVQQSIPEQGTPATEHHSRFANWANALGDLWREVKKHGK